ncbi:DsbA family protein [Limoniibacter endophyticus]|uniref:DSBA oxidoreductase n=1 Tax=Limoniibacter endophyticus TaxID=1565040 RepID=A0A8J3DNN8_9HYPH|nr:DsbA family protein [Limoniibacter endophyticus]GHC61096.1 DSBA oxidoreductase [Limoniibacter endophyticus]
MTSSFFRSRGLLSAAALAVATLAGQAHAQTVDKAEVEKIVREYLLANPEILFEMQQVLQTKQQDEQAVQQQRVIAAARDAIYNSKADGVVGNPDASFTVVEFFDYNCGYCKHALQDMMEITAENEDIRFVMKEFPILGQASKEASVVSMAVHRLAPEKYAEYHKDLLGAEGRVDGATAVQLAVSKGVDEAKLKAEMGKPEIEQDLAKTYALAESLAVNGTPAYVIGNEMVFGAMGKDTLLEKIAAAKQQSN